MYSCPTRLTTDKEAEAFVAEADLTQYDLSGLTPLRFESRPSKGKPNARGCPYQRFIRQALEAAVHRRGGV